jgi:hypothetical protein
MTFWPRVRGSLLQTYKFAMMSHTQHFHCLCRTLQMSDCFSYRLCQRPPKQSKRSLLGPYTGTITLLPVRPCLRCCAGENPMETCAVLKQNLVTGSTANSTWRRWTNTLSFCLISRRTWMQTMKIVVESSFQLTFQHQSRETGWRLVG